MCNFVIMSININNFMSMIKNDEKELRLMLHNYLGIQFYITYQIMILYDLEGQRSKKVKSSKSLKLDDITKKFLNHG